MPSSGKAALAALSLAAAVFAGRGLRPPAITVEEELPTAVSSPEPDAPIGSAGPARAEDARAVLARTFGPAVVCDPVPNFVTADLNGDGALDLIVAVRASSDRLSAVNDPFANWIIQDPRPRLPGEVRTGSRAQVEEDEPLLAVIHGFGPAGWRSPEARQAYLLRHAVGPGMEAVSRKDVSGRAAPPRLRGDVLALSRADDLLLVLYWTGARYALWRSPARARPPPGPP